MTPFAQISVPTTTIRHHTERRTATTAHNARLRCTDIEPDNDHADTPATMPIGGLFFLFVNPKRKRERFLTDAEFTRLGQVLDEFSATAVRYRPARSRRSAC